VFRTQAAVGLIDRGSYPLQDGFQIDIETPTARGYLVPPMDIPGCVALSLAGRVWEHLGFSEQMSLSAKGTAATRLVRQMIRCGLFPLPVPADEIADIDLQISGADIIIHPPALRGRDVIVQVKCDYPGGEKELGGTGNLFLQVSECNPFGIH